MLALDGIIQLTEEDEFAYQEMMTHVAMFSHPSPRKALVIGGGDGGVLRELSKHSCLERIDICEIDRTVIDISKKFFPSTACGFDDPRVNVHVMDGNAFIKGHSSEYDVIIVDSSDPIGPGEKLFEKPFYENMKAALTGKGIIASQAESIFLHPKIVAGLLKIAKELFPVHGYAYMLVPTYPGGNIGVCLGSLAPKVRKPARFPDENIKKTLKYYTPDIHEASFKLPAFAEEILK
jgi:spermidine synthase